MKRPIVYQQMVIAINPYDDGKAARRIAETIVKQ